MECFQKTHSSNFYPISAFINREITTNMGAVYLQLLLVALLLKVSWVFTGCHWISSDSTKKRNTFLKIIITIFHTEN